MAQVVLVASAAAPRQRSPVAGRPVDKLAEWGQQLDQMEKDTTGGRVLDPSRSGGRASFCPSLAAPAPPRCTLKRAPKSVLPCRWLPHAPPRDPRRAASSNEQHLRGVCYLLLGRAARPAGRAAGRGARGAARKRQTLHRKRERPPTTTTAANAPRLHRPDAKDDWWRPSTREVRRGVHGARRTPTRRGEKS